MKTNAACRRQFGHDFRSLERDGFHWLAMVDQNSFGGGVGTIWSLKRTARTAAALGDSSGALGARDDTLDILTVGSRLSKQQQDYASVVGRAGVKYG